MKHLVLSSVNRAGDIHAPTDAYVPIGHGLEVNVPEGAKLGDSWIVTIEPLRVSSFLHSCFFADQVFLTNSETNLFAIKGNLAVHPNTTAATDNPVIGHARPLPSFRGVGVVACLKHLLVAVGKTIYCTDIDNVWEWSPNPSSDADFKVFDWEPHNITALAKVDDVVFCHFPTSVYALRFVGKPTVFQVSEFSAGAGAVNSRAVQVIHSSQFFLAPDNFYILSTSGKQTIGDDIWQLFLRSAPDFQTIWSYHDPVNQEVCWVAGDYVWAFNYTNKHWQKYSTNSIIAHLATFTSSNFVPISESLSEIDKVRYDGWCNVWAAEDGLYREYVRGDDLGRVLVFDSPYLETDDFSFGDLHFNKTLSTLVVDYEFETPFRGVLVEASGREHIGGPDDWREFSMQNKTLAVSKWAPNVHGKILKYRFGVATRFTWLDGSLFWNGGIDFTGVKPYLMWDGELRFDGSWNYDTDIVVLDGTRSLGDIETPEEFMFRFNGYGQAVDLPSQLGPDK